MPGKNGIAFLSIWLAAVPATPTLAQAVRVPIAEGVWVKTATPCAAATIVYIHGGNRFGSLYFYGPNQSMGPADETEPLSRISPGKNGFTAINEGPLEVAARPNGQAVVRAVSPSEGVQWSETVRLCALASLPPRTRAAAARFGLR